MKFRRMLVLTGDKALGDALATEVFKLGAAKSAGLFTEPLEVLAQVLKLPLEQFTDPKLAKKKFPKGKEIIVDQTMLKKFTSKLSLRGVPVSLAGQHLHSPAEAAEYFFGTVAAHKDNGDWAVRRLLDWYDCVREGVYLVTDADDQIKELNSLDITKTLVFISVQQGESPDTQFDLSPHGGVGLVMRCGTEFDPAKGALELLQTVKNKYVTKNKKEVRNGRAGTIIQSSGT